MDTYDDEKKTLLNGVLLRTMNSMFNFQQIRLERTHAYFHVANTMWAATWQNQQNECAPREDSDQPGHSPSDQSLRCPHE